jgi:hypothetical protein
MNKFRLTIRLLCIATFVVAFASLTQAQATRTWVSGVGDDANPCSRTAPCKTFAGAISKTAAGGEIDALDPGGFGTVTITKSITLDGTGTFASILASATNGINVNDSATGTPGTIKVRLRGLSINGAGTTIGLNGINFTSGLSVWVEDCVIDTFSNAGINLNGSTASTNTLNIRNTVIRNCGDGIRIVNSATNTTAMAFDNIDVSKCTNGLNAGNGSRGAITSSTFAQNTSNQIAASQTTSVTDFVVSDSMVVGLGATVGSAVGVNVLSAGTHVRIARVVISNNVNALGLGGSIDTGGNNTIFGNGTNQDPNGTLFIQK